ncbi:MAG TPA: hypothetical protein VFX21_11085, partial [Acidimicrobiia bacterium]|nr:hypothetical protein [Acidimicrobiia bacterium]
MLDLDDGGDYVVLGDCAAVLPKLADASFQLVYVDPPFNTGKAQLRRTLRTVRAGTDDASDRIGFQGRAYTTTELGRMHY